MKVGIYTRVSTDLQVQRGESLDEQLHEAKSYCSYRNIDIIGVYREEGRSGKNTDRPELKRLLRDCKKGKIDTVIVKKLDRLSRSILDFEKMLRFFEEEKVTLISLKESFDTSSPMSRAAVRIVLVFAQLEREQTSERTRDAMAYRAKRGVWNGGYVPIGYDYVPKKGLVINESEAPEGRLIFEKYVELASYIKVANFMNASGYRTKRFKTKDGKMCGGVPYVNTHIARIIPNPVYIGKMPYKGEVYSGLHQPLISEELFNRAQEVRKANHSRNGSIKKDNKHNFILEGLLWCGECGSQMTPHWSIGKMKQRYFYYTCTKSLHQGSHVCSIKHISAPAIEQLILRRTRSIADDDVLFREVMAGNDEANYRRIEGLRQSERELDDKMAGIDKKVRMITDTFSETIGQDKGHVMALELDRLDKERKELIQRQQEARIEANDLETKTVSREAARETLRAFAAAYRPLSPYEKKALLSQIIHSVTYTKDQVSVRYYVVSELDQLAPERVRAGTRGGFAAHTTWLPSKDSNLGYLIQSQACYRCTTRQ